MNLSEILIKKMTNADINDILVLEKKCFDDPWTEAMFFGELTHENVYYFIATYEGKMIGYLGFWHIIDECHITNICVAPFARQCGVGCLLMEHMEEFCEKNDVVASTLEVRESNEKAINFYLKLGFKNEGIRKNYYSKPVENAIIMWKRH